VNKREGSLRYFATIKNGTTPASGEPRYWDGEIPWATPDDLGRLVGSYIVKTKRNVTQLAVAENNLNIVPVDSVLMSTRAPIGHMAITSASLTFNQGCRALIPKEETWGPYLLYLLKSRVSELNACANGTTFVELSRDDLAAVRIGLPLLEDQRRIAASLDEKTAQIDGLIAKKQALLDRLSEKRQAIITQVVTKGLNLAAPMKQSGIDWLGQIPAHWQVLPFGRSISRIEQGWSPECEDRQKDETEWGVLRSGCVNEGIFRPGDHKTLPAGLDPRPELEVRIGDLLMCRASGSLHLIGSAAQIDNCPPKLMFSDKTYRIKLDPDLADAKFTSLALSAKYMREQIILSVSGAGGLANNIPQSLVKVYKFVRPPLAEQREIAQRLSADLERMDAITRTIEQSVESLTEYRSALVTAAVNGQIEELR
jgi:type I restriction enzyme S subunit